MHVVRVKIIGYYHVLVSVLRACDDSPVMAREVLVVCIVQNIVKLFFCVSR
jgi:hypothetical protein